MGQLSAGSLFAHRFEIGRPAGSGGMGTVYRARDRYEGSDVALKLLHSGSSEAKEAERFTREAQILAELRHANIVSHIAHGQTPDGQRYLAMEWLDGEDLGQRLTRGPLSLRDCVTLLRHVAQALDVAHARGIIHRDLKPTNLFLCGGQTAKVKILDFGIARRLGTAQAVTQTGAVLGTPEYMAPEQARGVRELTPAADIFSLGCVLYECLTGQPPFVADHMAAVLVRILFEDPKPVEEFRLGVPQALIDLLAKMLHKDPQQRLGSAHALVDQLTGITELDETTSSLVETGPYPALKLLSFAEVDQQLFSVVIAAPPTPTPRPGSAPYPPSDEHLKGEQRQTLERMLQHLGLQADFLASGAVVVTVSHTGSATDQAAQAARAALLIKEQWPQANVSLATGRGAMQGRTAVGEVVDRAAQFLKSDDFGSRDSHPGSRDSHPGSSGGIRIDELSARLLEGRFMHTPRPTGALLLSEEKEVDATRPLLGKPTPCVGRETELGILEGQLSSSFEEPQAQAVLIIGLPGTGKSRLRHEFLRRVEKREDAVTVILGRGDLTAAGAPYGILAQSLQRFCGLRGGEPIEARRAALVSRVGRSLAASERTRVTEFLGELADIPFDDAGGGLLSAARRDPRIMHDQIRRAFIDWLIVETQEAGVLFVLDDLQWADTLSVGLLDIALRELRAAPLCVMALARPEVREIFPKLWPGHRLQEISLKPLSRKACERLVQQVLGKRVAADVVTRIVEQSTGNALFLEELIRAAGEGEPDKQPETVLAMLQARIGRFDPGPRRAVRAASVFGQTCWRGGIGELLGPQGDGQLDAWLNALVDAEVLEAHDNSRFAQEQEYGFRHALARDAAYSLLTEVDQRNGHQLAARFLSRVGEIEPLVLAEHHRQGGEPAQAFPLYVRAGEEASHLLALPEARRCYAQAKQLLDGMPASAEIDRSKIDVLLRQVQMGITSDPPEQNVSRLSEARALLNNLSDGHALDAADQRRSGWIDLLFGRIHYYQGHTVEAIGYYRRVLPVGEALNDKELLAVPSQLIGMALLVQGQMLHGMPLIVRAVSLLDHLDSDFERLRTLSMHGAGLIYGGHYHKGMAQHRAAMARAAETKQAAGLGLAQMIYADSLRQSGEVAAWLSESESAYQQAQKSGDKIYMYIGLSYLGWAHSTIGKHAQAIEYRDRARQLAAELGGQLIFSDWFAAADIEIALRAGDIAQALTLAEQRTALFRKENRIFALGLAEQYWGLACGKHDLKNFAQADAHFEMGIRVLEDAALHFPAARLRLEWAMLCKVRGSREQGAAIRSQAIKLFQAQDCVHLVEGIERICVFAE